MCIYAYMYTTYMYIYNLYIHAQIHTFISPHRLPALLRSTRSAALGASGGRQRPITITITITTTTRIATTTITRIATTTITRIATTIPSRRAVDASAEAPVAGRRRIKSKVGSWDAPQIRADSKT